MGIHAVYAFLVGDSDQLQHFQGTLLYLFLAHVRVMKFNDLIYLFSDAEHRIKSSHRLLEDHGDLIAAERFHDGIWRVHDVVRCPVAFVQTDLSADGLSARPCEKLHQRKACHGFAAA